MESYEQKKRIKQDNGFLDNKMIELKAEILFAKYVENIYKSIERQVKLELDNEAAWDQKDKSRSTAKKNDKQKTVIVVFPSQLKSSPVELKLLPNYYNLPWSS